MKEPALVLTMSLNGTSHSEMHQCKTWTYGGLWYPSVRFGFCVNSAPPTLSTLWQSFNPFSKVSLGWGIWSYLNGVLRLVAASAGGWAMGWNAAGEALCYRNTRVDQLLVSSAKWSPGTLDWNPGSTSWLCHLPPCSPLAKVLLYAAVSW